MIYLLILLFVVLALIAWAFNYIASVKRVDPKG